MGLYLFYFGGIKFRKFMAPAAAPTTTANDFIATTTTTSHSGDMRSEFWIMIGAALGIILLIFVLFGVTMWMLRRRTFGLTEEDIRAFREGIPPSSIRRKHVMVNIEGEEEIRNRNELNLRHTLRVTPYDARYEVSDSEFAIDQSALLGQGEFCTVRKALLRGMVVAAKTMIIPNKDNMKSLLTELKTMIHVGQHVNIVTLVGASTVKLSQGSCFLFLEFCEHGSLESYLRAHKSERNSAHKVRISTIIDIKRNYVEWEKPELQNDLSDLKVTPKPPEIGQHLLRWCREIAAGMAYLSELQVVHGDLATRNVLLSAGLVVKISDFGLSKKVYRYSGNIVESNDVLLPYRHLAPESLTQLTFSTYSDVWSFGITMWEIYTLGDVPFVEKEWTPGFAEYIVHNNPRKPKYSSDEIYGVMRKCWTYKPKERPSFNWLHLALTAFSAAGADDTTSGA